MTGIGSSADSRIGHDHDRAFKQRTKGVKRFGLWAAEAIGLTGDAAEAYAREVVMADFEEVGDDDILAKVGPDLAAAGLAPERVRQHLDAFLHAEAGD